MSPRHHARGVLTVLSRIPSRIPFRVPSGVLEPRHHRPHARARRLDRVRQPCSGDYDGDGSVGGGDLATLLSSWGAASGDLDGDGIVGGSDLATLLSNWGACP